MDIVSREEAQERERKAITDLGTNSRFDDPVVWPILREVCELAHSVVALHNRVAEQAAEIERLRACILTLAIEQTHVDCDDGWYSCPKSFSGCLDDQAGPECNCGADEWNARVRAAKDILEKSP